MPLYFCFVFNQPTFSELHRLGIVPRKILKDCWNTFLQGGCLFCYLTNSVNVLKKTRTLCKAESRKLPPYLLEDISDSRIVPMLILQTCTDYLVGICHCCSKYLWKSSTAQILKGVLKITNTQQYNKECVLNFSSQQDYSIVTKTLLTVTGKIVHHIYLALDLTWNICIQRHHYWVSHNSVKPAVPATSVLQQICF